MRISASFDSPAPSRHRRDSPASDEAVGGLFFDFEPVRTASVGARAAAAMALRRWRRAPRRRRGRVARERSSARRDAVDAAARESCRDGVHRRRSLGAWTAAEEGAKFFANVVNEQSANPRMLIIHECMGRDCGYLTAATAKAYMDSLHGLPLLPGLNLTKQRKGLHAVYVPEVRIDVDAEARRLKRVMDTHDCVNIFLSRRAPVFMILRSSIGSAG